LGDISFKGDYFGKGTLRIAEYRLPGRIFVSKNDEVTVDKI
jgi:hypothetical protein